MISGHNSRPRASLGRVLDDLGTTLLERVAGSTEPDREIGGVVIHDPIDPPVLPPNALVLGVAVHDSEQVITLLSELGKAGAAGLVVRSPVQLTPEVRAAVARTGVALLGFSRGAAWAQLAAMLRSVLAVDEIRLSEQESLGGQSAGDLFAVANAISALLDAPITIEDRSSRVLAFSGRQDEADPSRVETILGRQVPERYSRILQDRGVFRELHRSDRPITITPGSEGNDAFSMSRVAIAVRAGDEVLGSIWAAVPRPLSAERTDALCDAAKLVALHLLRVRAGSDVHRRLRADILSTALEGGPDSRQALDRLGLANESLIVLGVTTLENEADAVPTSEGAAVAHARERLSDAFALHLSAVHPRAAAALIGDVSYGLVPVVAGVEGGEERAVRIGHDFLGRLGERLKPVVAIGPVAADASELARARAQTDRALRVLRESPGGRRIARLDDVEVDALILELRDEVAARGDRPTGALARLIAYDREHQSHFVETVCAWLDAFGDITAASAALFVHQNTFRYRLRRLAEIAELDLTDPDQRFAVMLQLRVLPDGSPRIAERSATPGADRGFGSSEAGGERIVDEGSSEG